MRISQCRNLTAAEISAYRDEGVALAPALIDRDTLDALREASHAQMNRPTKWAGDLAPPRRGQLFMDRHMSAFQDNWRQIVFDSGQGKVAAQAMGSDEVRLYFDHLWIHGPRTPDPYRWHQNGPYWPFKGQQICSVWLAVENDSAIETVRGSHRWGKWYRPVLPGASDELAQWIGQSADEDCPDFDALRNEHEFVCFELSAGDALILDARIVHALPGNPDPAGCRIGFATHLLGDDATWDPRPGTDPIITQADVRLSPGDAAIDDAFPLLWRREP
jgi:ectoine hydroxylase-related dioxygenase (phytanoyl-CoA dioxygenase family)